LNSAVSDLQTASSSQANTIASLQNTVSNLQSGSTGDTVQKLGTLTANTTVNFANGNYATMTIGAALALAFSGVPDNTHAYGMTLKITNGGAFAITWPAGVTWLNTVNFKSAGVNLITLITDDGGATWTASGI
jgi:hypothetical protein